MRRRKQVITMRMEAQTQQNPVMDYGIAKATRLEQRLHDAEQQRDFWHNRASRLTEENRKLRGLVVEGRA